jgi:hypothetical protein
MVRMRGVTTVGVDWASGETSDLAYGLNDTLWYLEELQILTEVFLVH